MGTSRSLVLDSRIIRQAANGFIAKGLLQVIPLPVRIIYPQHGGQNVRTILYQGVDIKINLIGPIVKIQDQIFPLQALPEIVQCGVCI